MRLRFVTYPVAAASMLFACSHDSKSASKSTANAEDFCHSLFATTVERQTRCFGGGESFWKGFYARVSSCDGLAKQIADGKMVYDQAKAAKCLDQVKALACDSTFAAGAGACTEALVGQAPNGGACARLSSFETCAPGGTCSSVDNSCAGVCKPVADPGSPCVENLTPGAPLCTEGFSCQFRTHLCVADAGEGEPCLGPSAGDCGHNLTCVFDTGDETGTCRKRRTSGACTSSSDCATGYSCAGYSRGAKTCRKTKFPGESCTPGMGECYYFFSWCGRDGICTDTGAQENEPCGDQGQGYDEYILCAIGLTCASDGTSASTCRKSKPAGSPCTYRDECAGTGAYCDTETKLCVSCE